MKKQCVIFSAGDVQQKPDIPENSYIIAADAGYKNAKKCGFVPDLLIGDFDSLSCIPCGIEAVKYPAEKDYTDTELAIKTGIEKGCNSFFVVGALGGTRFEHTVANLQLAAGISKQGYGITLTDGNTFIKAITNGKAEFDSSFKGYVSVFSFHGDSKGVTIKGLKYELNDVTLPCTGTLGVSNEFCGISSEISVEHGTLLIIYRRKDGDVRL